ncbi:murein transglycosylase A [Orbaceae bacterium ac157xtp]
MSLKIFCKPITWFGCYFIIFNLLVGCNNRPTAQGQQYNDGEFLQPLNLSQPELPRPVNSADFLEQIKMLEQSSPSLYSQNREIYQAIKTWIEQDYASNQVNQVGLSSYRLAGQDNWGNVHLTGYYTPVIKASRIPDEKYRYPLYTKPNNWQGIFPTREEIYAGAFANQYLELAYTESLIDNFIMEVQGSGYIDFEDENELVFLGYNGKNGHPYQSIGRLLIEQGEIERDKISMQAIKEWASKQSEQVVTNLLIQNKSAVFFKPQNNGAVIGSAGVPLIAKAAVASDPKLIPTGSILLVEYPLLDEHGVFKGERELRIMLALDVGGAIKGHHLDVYQGIGEEAGEQAGFYNHFGRVWLLKPVPNGHLAL